MSMKDLHLAPSPYSLPPVSGRAIRVTRYTGEPDFRFHYHPEYELTLTLGSRGRRLVGDNITEYAQRDLVLLGPQVPHTWAAESRPNHSQPMENIVIHFTRASIGLDFLNRAEMKEIVALLSRAQYGLCFTGRSAEIVAEQLHRLPTLKRVGQLISFLDILQQLAGCTHPPPLVSAEYMLQVHDRHHHTHAVILKYIHDHLDTPIRLQDIAHHAHMSVPSFCRFFRRATGRSFIDYVNDWRIGRACALLGETTHSILEISTLTGFNNLSHFNRQFLRRRHVSPRHFRQSLQSR